MLTINQEIPSFSLPGVKGAEVRNYTKKDLDGCWTILFFYPEDFSFICPTEVTGFNKHFEELQTLQTKLFGISVDPIDIHKEWIKELKINYPLLSDENGELAKKFGVLDTTDNRAHRATFIINPDLKVEFAMINSRNIGRSVEETMRVLRAILHGTLCPADYDPLKEA
ncbi:MAG: peroxiredoxin [Methanobacteriota archaeon]|nr:MAG: peroxiredoxin [Euryarchaeota archaeon]